MTDAAPATALAFGAKVECDYQGRGKWYPGTIMGINEDKYDILFDDGDGESGVPATRIRAKGAAPAAASEPAPRVPDSESESLSVLCESIDSLPSLSAAVLSTASQSESPESSSLRSPFSTGFVLIVADVKLWGFFYCLDYS